MTYAVSEAAFSASAAASDPGPLRTSAPAATLASEVALAVLRRSSASAWARECFR